MTNPAGILVDDGHLFCAETATASTSSSFTENEEEIGFINRFLTLADAALSGAERTLRVSPNHSDWGLCKTCSLAAKRSLAAATICGNPGKAEGGDPLMPPRVLLADDHPAVRKTLRALLSEASIGICAEVENGRQALAKAGELQPDVIVLDLVMPEMNGLEAAYEIRQCAPRSKIILLSLHYPPQEGSALASALRADAFVHKSALANDLLPTMARLLPVEAGKPEAVLAGA